MAQDSIVVAHGIAPGGGVSVGSNVARIIPRSAAMKDTGPNELTLAQVQTLDQQLAQALSATGAISVQCARPDVKPQRTQVLVNGIIHQLFDFGRVFSVNYPSIEACERAVAQLRANSAIDKVWQDTYPGGGGIACNVFCQANTVLPYECQSFNLTTDPFLGGAFAGEQWYLFQDESFLGSYGRTNEDIHSVCAWSSVQARGHRGVILALLDSGIDFWHPDLAYTYSNASWGTRILPGRNFCSGFPNDPEENDPNIVIDYLGHGTRIIGVGAAISDNGVTDPGGKGGGMAGVAGGRAAYYPDSVGVRILPVKMLSRQNTPTLTGKIAEAINYAAENGARVLNMSWVLGYGDPPPEDLADEIRYAMKNAMILGATCVAGSGNEDALIRTYPAAMAKYGLAIAVGGSDYCGRRWSRYNLDIACATPFDGSTYGDYLDVIAPAFDIRSTDNGGVLGTGVYYSTDHGTSYATSMVSGVAATLIGLNPALRDNDIKHILRATAQNTSSESEVFVGKGRVNHARAAVAVGNPDARLVTGFATVYSSDVNEGQYNIWFKKPDDPTICTELGNCTFVVQRHELKFNVVFPTQFKQGSVPITWVRVLGTKGWSSASSIKEFGYGWGEPVEGTITESGAAYRTYVYYAPNFPGGARWLPCSPAEAQVEWAALGDEASVTAVEPRVRGNPSLKVIGGPVVRTDRVELALEGAVRGRIRIAVYDVKGRRVADLSQVLAESADATIVWEVSEESGRGAGPGVYFIRWQTGHASGSEQVILLR